MLTSEEIRRKLFELPISFDIHYRNKEYYRAKRCYDIARMVSAFIQLSDEDCIKLFGNRSYKDDREELTDGLFAEEKVEKVYWICIRAGKTYDKEDYRQKNSP